METQQVYVYFFATRRNFNLKFKYNTYYWKQRDSFNDRLEKKGSAVSN